MFGLDFSMRRTQNVTEKLVSRLPAAESPYYHSEPNPLSSTLPVIISVVLPTQHLILKLGLARRLKQEHRNSIDLPGGGYLRYTFPLKV
jgi:hypothetical protein